jgi:carbamoyl-phosphate synthase small subunit
MKNLTRSKAENNSFSKALLLLEDGSLYRGYSFGRQGEAIGEVVFNTSMTGYQEIISDPSYAGQIVVLTYPLIGNYGTVDLDMESERLFLSGLIVREKSRLFSNWRAQEGLDKFLRKNQLVAIENVDTRAITRRIRSAGAMKGIISSDGNQDINQLMTKLKAFPDLVGRDLAKTVTVNDSYLIENRQAKYKVVAMDFGIKQNILNLLKQSDCQVKVVPADTSASEILSDNPDGLFLSNGPGDPEPVSYAIKTIQLLLGKLPIFGICLGHQLLSLALGAKTFKLKFGHHGGNHPVKNLMSGEIEITAQNHGFAVDEESLAQAGGGFGKPVVTHRNLNDGTVEGLICQEAKAFSVQYHPEASPGPHDSRYLFTQFTELMEVFKERGRNV